MSIEAWWPNLDAHTRAWLVDNNGAELSAEARSGIAAAGGTFVGVRLPDDAVDWIEALANGE